MKSLYESILDIDTNIMDANKNAEDFEKLFDLEDKYFFENPRLQKAEFIRRTEMHSGLIREEFAFHISDTTEEEKKQIKSFKECEDIAIKFVREVCKIKGFKPTGDRKPKQIGTMSYMDIAFQNILKPDTTAYILQIDWRVDDDGSTISLFAYESFVSKKRWVSRSKNFKK